MRIGWIAICAAWLAASQICTGAPITVTAIWIPNDASEQVTGYTIYFSRTAPAVSSEMSTNFPAAGLATYQTTNVQKQVTFDFAPGDTWKFEITATNSAGESDRSASALFSGSTSSGQPPTIAVIADMTMAEDSTSTPIPFTVADHDGSTSSLNVGAFSSNQSLVANSTANLMLSGTDGSRTLTIKPLTNAVGTTSISVIVTNSNNLKATNTFTLTVTNINDAPRIAGGIPSELLIIGVNGTANLTILLEDVDPGTTSLQLTAASSDVSVVPLGGLMISGSGLTKTLQINAGSVLGESVITLTASDSLLNSLPATFQVSVQNLAPINQRPTFEPPLTDRFMREGESLSLSFRLVDDGLPQPVQGLAITEITSSNPDLIPVQRIVQGNSTGDERVLTLNPLPGQSGRSFITVSASDGELISTALFYLTVERANHPPEFGPISDVKVLAGGSVVVEFRLTDSTSDLASVTVRAASEDTSLVQVSQPTATAGDISTQSLVVSALPGVNGSTVVHLTATDGDGASSVLRFQVTVEPNESAPVLVFEPTVSVLEIWENSTTEVRVLVGDPGASPDGVTLSVSAADTHLLPNAAMTLGGTGSERVLTLAPPSNLHGTAVVTVTATDQGGLAASASFTLRVRELPVGDFDQDGAPEVVLQHAVDRSLKVWNVRTPFLQPNPVDIVFDDGLSAAAPAGSWVAATADFDNDTPGRRPDLLLQNSSGDLSAWVLDGLIVRSRLSMRRLDAATDLVVAVADLDRDGLRDLVIQAANRTLSAWRMSGTRFLSLLPISPSLPPDPGAWRVVGSGDFTGDGYPDLAMRDSDGTLAIYPLGFDAVTASAVLRPGMHVSRQVGDPFAGSDFGVAAVNDFDGDSLPDFLFQGELGSQSADILGIGFQENSSIVAVSRFIRPFGGPGWRAVGGK